MSCRIVVCRVALSCVISYVVSDCRMSFNIVVCRTKYFPRARHTTTWHDTRQSETTHDIISIKCRAIVDCLPVLRKVFTGVEERFYRCALSSENDVKRRKVALNNNISAVYHVIQFLIMKLFVILPRVFIYVMS